MEIVYSEDPSNLLHLRSFRTVHDINARKYIDVYGEIQWKVATLKWKLLVTHIKHVPVFIMYRRTRRANSLKR